MAHYDIFRQELAIHLPAHGHALWEPSPGDLYELYPVEIGDVGFIRQGRFHRLFNCLLPADHPSHEDFGVPEYHEPLELNVPQRASVVKRTLDPNNFCSNEVMTLGGQAVFAPGPEPEQISFSCSRQGAILSLPVPAQRRDTLAQGDFGKWMVTHIDLWYAFTRRLGLGITRMEDIVLVTGCDLTRSWANIAFLQGRGEARVSFGVHVTDVQGTGAPNIGWQFPPEERQRVELNLGPNGQNLPEDQCIFIRGFRVTRLLGILPRLRAAAGPSQNPDQDEPELDMQLLNISADSNYQDPLHTLLEYIAMKAPDCDMILVHDNDLMRIDDVETLKTNTVIGHPRRAMPEVWQVQCGETEAETPILKVATLSKNPFGTPANVSQPLAVPASDLPSPFGEPRQSSHAPGDDHKQKRPMKQTKPPANIRKYDAATEAQYDDWGTSLHGKLRKVELARSVKSKTLPDRGQKMPPESAVAHMERSGLLEGATAKDKDGLTPLHRALCPDPSVRSSPQAISVDLPHDPPAITSWQNFPAVIVEGVIFDKDHVQVECNLISPSSYPISDVIPLRLILTSQNREALDLFGVSQAIDVRLQKVLAFGERASAIQPLRLANRNDYYRADFAGKAHWELDGHARQLPSNDEYSRPRWCMELNGKLRREAHVELTPSFEQPGAALKYFVSLFPFRSPNFRPTRDPSRELVMGKIQLTGTRLR